MSLQSSPSRRGSKGRPMSEAEMLHDIAEDVLADAMQDLIMKDILLEIIQNNEVSKMTDSIVELDDFASKLAESVMRDTVLNMLQIDVAEPLLTVAATEKKALSNALLNLKDFKMIEKLTRGVVHDCIN